MKRISLVLILIICTSWTNNENDFLRIVTSDYLSDIDKYLYDGAQERLSRIVLDINNDGLTDVLMSGYHKGEWGNGGGLWTIYFQQPKDSFLIGKNKIFMHPDVARFNVNKAEIIKYSGLGCCEGIISYFKIRDLNTELKKSIKLKESNGYKISSKIDSIFYSEIGLEKFNVEKANVRNVNNIDWN
tara:strand:- start:63 stop:620 length:558 start_codon:yes stop_codon:yes gene_type:complete